MLGPIFDGRITQTTYFSRAGDGCPDEPPPTQFPDGAHPQISES
jgi:hypothetical protein